MKKYLFSTLAIALFILTGCGGSTSEDAAPVSGNSPETKTHSWDGWERIQGSDKASVDWDPINIWKKCDGSTLVYLTTTQSIAVVPDSDECREKLPQK